MTLEQRKRLLLFPFFLLPFLSFAQDEPFGAGVAAGVNTSQVSGDDLSGFHQFGLSGGFFVSRAISENTSLELQMLYSQKGSRKTPDPESGDHTSYNLRVNYIDLPLLLDYRTESGIDLFGGPLVGVRVGEVTEEDHNGEFPGSNRPSFNPYDVGVHLGLGYYFNDNFTMDLRFSNSVLSARDHTGNSQSAQGTARRLNRGQYHTVVTFLMKYRLLGK